MYKKKEKNILVGWVVYYKIESNRIREKKDGVSEMRIIIKKGLS
jgi:hypothetical protein